MGKIVLISCVSMKRDVSCKSKDMYISPLFIKSYNYAKSLNPDNIYILSAKYGLIDEDEIIEPYNLTLNNFTKREKKQWTSKVLASLREKTSLTEDHFYILAGKNYYESLLEHMKNYSIIMEGLSIGRRLKWLDEHIISEYSLF